MKNSVPYRGQLEKVNGNRRSQSAKSMKWASHNSSGTQVRSRGTGENTHRWAAVPVLLQQDYTGSEKKRAFLTCSQEMLKLLVHTLKTTDLQDK